MFLVLQIALLVVVFPTIRVPPLPVKLWTIPVVLTKLFPMKATVAGLERTLLRFLTFVLPVVTCVSAPPVMAQEALWFSPLCRLETRGMASLWHLARQMVLVPWNLLASRVIIVLPLGSPTVPSFKLVADPEPGIPGWVIKKFRI